MIISMRRMVKKLSVAGLIFLIFLYASCNFKNSKKYTEELNSLQKQYRENKSFENALMLGEFLNNESNGVENRTQGMEIIAQLNEDFPDSGEIAILHGNLKTLLAGAYSDEQDFVNAMKYIDEGLSILDKTVRENPDNGFILLYRAINSISLPDMFGRLNVGLGDFEKLYSMGELSKVERILTLLNYAKALEMNGEADKAAVIMEELETEYPNYKEDLKESDYK